MKKTILSVHNLLFQRAAKTYLEVQDLSLYKSEILGIIGPNGAGKSTLIKLMSFLESQSSGTIQFEGAPYTAASIPLAIRRELAVVMQQSLLLDTTAAKNVSSGLKLRKIPRSIIKERTEYWLEQLSISHLANRNARFLSGGEAQRVNLARALVLQPKILFMDEPFSALDYPSKVKLLKDLKPLLQETETTAVFVSHDLEEIKFLTDRLAVLINGKLGQIGCTADVLNSPAENTKHFLNGMVLN
ncbi:ATP-binding cassette domain-containing protein [Cytobacillus gottheilii]|uniref:ABC transporter ATP-binding protein n=1 Tax=Cytobacillus gottheilii TaxID=859144 RepID=A0ABX8FB15_9BACI|nr:ABC transporter ATP-binding protein [Cytobacillus gottheilii]QVY61028.1 ABC transporter ATP-binding protein [Cytobacillus gottheilii]